MNLNGKNVLAMDVNNLFINLLKVYLIIIYIVEKDLLQ